MSTADDRDDDAVHRTEVDGVAVAWRAAPGVLTAGLVLGVGRRDEDYATSGVTHLLEHLVIHEARSRRLSANASVDLVTTEFTASGRPDLVADFLRRVCELLADPPVGRLAVELSVLAAEAREKGGPDLVGCLRGERFGNGRCGVTAMPEPAVRALTAESVRAWAARWAVRGNAALWLTGPVPKGLSLPLPVGPHPAGDRTERVVGAVPASFPLPDAPVALSAVVPHGTASTVAVGILQERLLDELRHRRGLTYGVDVTWERLSEDDRHVLLTTEVEEARTREVVGLLRDVLGDLAARGPGVAELAEEVEAFRGDPEDADDVRNVEEEVQSVAECLVMGWTATSVGAARADADALALRPEDVRDVARTLERSALVVVPEGVELDLPGLPRRPEWSPETVTGRAFRPRWWKGTPRRSRLVVGEDGAMLHLRGDERITVLWEDVLALVEDDSEGFTHRLVGARGFGIPLDAGDWLGGREALRLVQERVPAGKQVRADWHSRSGDGDR